MSEGKTRHQLRPVRFGLAAPARHRKEVEKLLHPDPGVPEPESACWIRVDRPLYTRMINIDHSYYMVEDALPGGVTSVQLYWLRQDGYWYRFVPCPTR